MRAASKECIVNNCVKQTIRKQILCMCTWMRPTEGRPGFCLKVIKIKSIIARSSSSYETIEQKRSFLRFHPPVFEQSAVWFGSAHEESDAPKCRNRFEAPRNRHRSACEAAGRAIILLPSISPSCSQNLCKLGFENDEKVAKMASGYAHGACTECSPNTILLRIRSSPYFKVPIPKPV